MDNGLHFRQNLFRINNMKTRGQKIKLRNNKSGKELDLVVILADSIQGYLADSQEKYTHGGPVTDGTDGLAGWYNLNDWSEIK